MSMPDPARTVSIVPPSTPGRKRRIVRADETPAEALTWKTQREKAEALRRWRLGVGIGFAEHPRCIRVAWVLEWFFAVGGYAYATDAFLSREMGLRLNRVQATLTKLVDGGAIVRVHAQVGARLQRRIYPARASADRIPPIVGAIDTPHGRPNTTSTRVGGHKTEETADDKFVLRSPTLRYARNDARRKAARVPTRNP
jgi:hypothetical protein